MAFSRNTREQHIERMKSETFDLAIIGGGINGAGVARDAVSRGMKVALIEADDFASGTSSRSSKLIHGGIRYLENLEFGLVFEALQERRTLFEMAPNLVHHLRFILPVYKSSRVGMFKMGLGMMLYDALATFEMPELHERLNRHELVGRVPNINADDLCGGYEYSDAYMDDDRLVIETLRSAVRQGAAAASYVKATGAVMNNGKLSELVATDLKTNKEFKIKARHFVSTVGAWTDIVAPKIVGEWKPLLRPAKGVHLTFRRDRMPLNQAVVMASDDEKRIVFAIPRYEMVIVGTTDTDYKGDPAAVKTQREDVDYLLHVAGHYFPGARLTEQDILASYAGVRPLVYDGAATESKTSREHTILPDERNVTFVAGGKYTTYRKIAEDVMKTVLDQFTFEERIKFGRNNTATPLNPDSSPTAYEQARRHAEQLARDSGVHVGIVNYLVERHAGEAKSIIAKFQPKAKGVHAVWHYEALHAMHETMCLSLRDFYLRRSHLFLARHDHGFLLLNELSQLFQSELGWSENQRLQEVEAVRNHLQYEMGWRRAEALQSH